MNGWYWVCPLDKDPTLWDEWRRRSIASLGWEPGWVRERPDQRRKLEKTKRKVLLIQPGDRVVAYLKNGRIGGTGKFVRVLGLDDSSWHEIGNGFHGRLVRVTWDNLPPDGCYVSPGE